MIQHQVPLCTSYNGVYFRWTLYIVQATLLAFGAFLAWETRQVFSGTGADPGYLQKGILIFTKHYVISILCAHWFDISAYVQKIKEIKWF